MKLFICLTLFSFSGFAKEISFKDLADTNVETIEKLNPRGVFVGPPHIVLIEGPKESKQGYIPPRRPDYMDFGKTTKGDFQSYKSLSSIGRPQVP
jgi:hypothetical protein